MNALQEGRVIENFDRMFVNVSVEERSTPWSDISSIVVSQVPGVRIRCRLRMCSSTYFPVSKRCAVERTE